MDIFNSYVKLPEGISCHGISHFWKPFAWFQPTSWLLRQVYYISFAGGCLRSRFIPFPGPAGCFLSNKTWLKHVEIETYLSRNAGEISEPWRPLFLWIFFRKVWDASGKNGSQPDGVDADWIQHMFVRFGFVWYSKPMLWYLSPVFWDQQAVYISFCISTYLFPKRLYIVQQQICVSPCFFIVC